MALATDWGSRPRDCYVAGHAGVLSCVVACFSASARYRYLCGMMRCGYRTWAVTRWEMRDALSDLVQRTLGSEAGEMERDGTAHRTPPSRA